MCRNTYNNKLKTTTSQVMRNVNAILRKNRRILEELTRDQTVKSTRSKLLKKGFDFGYHTNIRTTKKGTHYFFCYEYGYLSLEKGHYVLVKRNEEK